MIERRRRTVSRAIVWTAGALTLAACGGGGEANKATAKADTLQPGQYEVTAAVTSFRAADKGTPKINTKQGDSTTRSVCVADGAALPPDLFADDGFTCRNSGDMYARGGTLNVTLQCDVAGQRGSAGYSVTGSFGADSFEAERSLETLFSTDGDVVIASTITGRRTGDCTAAPAAANAGAEKAK